MKKVLLFLALALFVAGCNKPSGENDNPQHGTEQPDTPDNPDPQGPTDPADPTDPSGPTGPSDPEPVVYTEPFLVTSEIIMQFIQNVTYKERDYSYTHVTDPEYAPYGAPGNADLPPTVPVSWEAPAEYGPLTLNLSDGEWAYDISLPAGTTSYELSNLVPGRDYSYTVKREDTGAVVGLGSFSTVGLVHQVFFHSKVRNARDLGGWSTTSGKKVKYRKLFRGGEITSSYLNNKGIQEMLNEGIRAEIDLREAKDLSSSKSRLGDDIAFYNADLSKGYGGMLRDFAGKVASTFQFTVKCLRENKPVYFHCSIGRDRTGTMAALYLGLLGVSESDISKEYELLFFSPADWSLNGGKTEFDYSRTKQYGLRYACDTIWQLGGKALGVSDTNYEVSFARRAEAYLLANGVSQQDIDDFRSLMLD